METIRLEFRRGGGWITAVDVWYAIRKPGTQSVLRFMYGIGDGTMADFEYAKLPPFEDSPPDPEPLRIEGCSDPIILNGCKGWVCQSRYPPPDGYEACVYVTAPTRRVAIEAYNAAAKVRGATE